jgi:predicted transcriptional regulator
MIHISWRNVTSICISRCCEKAGFSMSLTSGNAEMQENSDSDDENDDDIPLANLFNICNRLDQIGFTMDDLVNVDSEVVSTESKSDDDIVTDLLNKESDMGRFGNR